MLAKNGVQLPEASWGYKCLCNRLCNLTTCVHVVIFVCRGPPGMLKSQMSLVVKHNSHAVESYAIIICAGEETKYFVHL